MQNEEFYNYLVSLEKTSSNPALIEAIRTGYAIIYENECNPDKIQQRSLMEWMLCNRMLQGLSNLQNKEEEEQIHPSDEDDDDWDMIPPPFV